MFPSCPCCCCCNDSHCLTVTIGINQPFQCKCTPSSSTLEIETSDVISGLLKYNSNLTKYLSKYQSQYTSNDQKQYQQQMESNPQHKPLDPNRSIVDIYNLKVLPSSQTDNKPNENKPNQLPPTPTQQIVPTINKTQSLNIPQPTSPKNVKTSSQQYPIQQTKQKYQPGSNQDKINKHLKQVKLNSRYLSNTGFKKYFGRQCFENYGRQNRNGVADGIIYNNYLKTFNISPHCGNNLPITEETDRRTLVAGNAELYEKKQPLETHYGNQADRKAADGFHNKPLSQMDEVIEESQHRKKQLQKYTIKLPPSHQKPICQTAQNHFLQNKQTSATQVLRPEIKPTPSNQPTQKIVNIPRKYSLQQENYPQDNKYPRKFNKLESNKSQQVTTNIKYNIDNQRQTQNYQTKPIITKPNFLTERQQQQNQMSTDAPKIYRQQDWQRNNEDNSQRFQQKQEIMNHCFGNHLIAIQIQNSMKPPCCLCKNNRYTKCCFCKF